ncbi:transposase-like protein [Cytobacillus purgationiresistens]|uniref:Mutator family transposase n=1 Tax=Cytobacillus purgationiresistens TaxID=863449 RepID=A0ABU0ALP4_9BACI|nr:transposase-like protein [Cytobacillus purgationiresistens]
MYTTNAVESIHASFRKVTKKGVFPHENALFKLLYLRIQELETKWEGGHIQNWSMVMNQFLLHEKLKERALTYLE